MKDKGHTKPLQFEFASRWARLIYRHAVLLLATAMILTVIAFQGLRTLSISTEISGLMPKGAPSVRALDAALEQIGSYASIQVVVESTSREHVLALLSQAQMRFEQADWVEYSQYFEDVEGLIDRQLLLLSLDELLTLEADLEAAYPDVIADYLRNVFGADATVTLRNRQDASQDRDGSNTSRSEPPLGRIKAFERSIEMEDRRYFLSDDGLTGVLLVWPKPGNESLLASKAMIDDSVRVIEDIKAEASSGTFMGVGGRIASQVNQFDAIIKDLRVGLISAGALIASLLLMSYRSVVALPLILIPLMIGIVWTLGLAAITVGGLNLITVFLTLILFGLGIDFAIHNFSRYREERQDGHGVEAALQTMIRSTGSASLIAALTTGLAFFALIFTEFRAFTEFGIIAGSGIGLIFLAMYSVQPCLIVLMERVNWSVFPKFRKGFSLIDRLSLHTSRFQIPILGLGAALIISSSLFAPHIRFEVDTKRLEAKMPEAHVAATERIRRVITTPNSRAIILAKSYQDLIAIEKTLASKKAAAEPSGTIKNVSSLLDFIPEPNVQQERLEVIQRLNRRAQDLQSFDRERFETSRRFLDIGRINIADLPNSLRRAYIGQPKSEQQNEIQYLLYVAPDVNMDNADEAARFYADVGQFKVGDQTVRAASESFILVEMLELMKADALRAILLVGLTTFMVVFLFIRSLTGTLLILAPTLIGLLITLGVMGAFGPALSIMNMVVLPSLIGISVDNSIHIVHRFKADYPTANITSIMSTTGRAAVLTTLTTLIGFGGMITASMLGLRSLAQLAIIGFLACLAVTWLGLPILMEHIQRRARRTEVYAMEEAS